MRVFLSPRTFKTGIFTRRKHFTYMKIKVCGLRRPDNIAAIAQLPVDFLGLIFYPQSPRYAASEALAKWIEQQKAQMSGISLVGVFVNAEIEEVLNAVHDYHLDFVQLHGDESPDYCRELDAFRSLSSMRTATLIKAFRVDEHFDFDAVAPYAAWCRFALFDARGTQYGGTGASFDWNLLRKYQGPLPFFLSGGISENDAETLRALKHPFLAGVDINSRFETEPGIKDAAQIARFINMLKT